MLILESGTLERLAFGVLGGSIRSLLNPRGFL